MSSEAREFSYDAQQPLKGPPAEAITLDQSLVGMVAEKRTKAFMEACAAVPRADTLVMGRATEKSFSEMVQEKPKGGDPGFMGPRVLEAASPALSKMDELTGLRGPTFKEFCNEKPQGAPPCAWSPGATTVATLKKSPLQNPLDGCQYSTELLHRASGVRVERYWDRDIAYLDILRFSSEARIPFQEWALGDGLERCYAAHQAVAPGRCVGAAAAPVFHYIHHLEVAAVARKKGIGRALLNVAVTSFREMENTPWIWLCANSPGFGDEDLIHWYEKSGFRRISPVTTIMYFDNNWTKRCKIDPTRDPAVPYVMRP